MSVIRFSLIEFKNLLDSAFDIISEQDSEDSKEWVEGYLSIMGNEEDAPILENNYEFSEKQTEHYQKWVKNTENLKDTLVLVANQVCIFKGMDRDDMYYYYRLYDPIQDKIIVIDTMFGLISLKSLVDGDAYQGLVHNYNCFTSQKLGKLEWPFAVTKFN